MRLRYVTGWLTCQRQPSCCALTIVCLSSWQGDMLVLMLLLDGWNMCPVRFQNWMLVFFFFQGYRRSSFCLLGTMFSLFPQPVCQSAKVAASDVIWGLVCLEYQLSSSLVSVVCEDTFFCKFSFCCSPFKMDVLHEGSLSPNWLCGSGYFLIPKLTVSHRLTLPRDFSFHLLFSVVLCLFFCYFFVWSLWRVFQV